MTRPWRERESKSLTGANPRTREPEPDPLRDKPLVFETPDAPRSIEKPIPLRSREYREYVSGLPCAWCQRPAPSEPSHHGAHGMASKTDDYRCIPLCHRCHIEEYHRTMRLGAMTVEDTKSWIAEKIIRTLIGWIQRLQEDAL